MEKIEKKIEKTYYVAFDGTEFENEDECMIYESSEVGALMKELQPCIVGTEYNGYKTYYLMPRTRHDIDTLNKVFNLSGSDDKVTSGDLFVPMKLEIITSCNIIHSAILTRLDEEMRKCTNNKFSVVSLIKEEKTENKK